MLNMKLLALTILLAILASEVQCRRGGGFSRGGSRGGSRTSSSGGSWWSSTKVTSNKPSYGWSNPSAAKPAPAPSSSGSYGWSKPNTAARPPPAPSAPASPTFGWSKPNTAVKPPPSAPASPSGSYGWTKPAAAKPPPPPPPAPPVNKNTGWNQPVTKTNAAATKSDAPSSNIGPGGYPVQGGVQRNPPPYSPTNTHGTPSFNSRPAPPAYSPNNPHNSPPSYNSHYTKKQVVNNHYHYHGPPPAYSQPSHFGMSSAYYPQQSSFGYPGGYYGSSYRPTYGGMSLFSSGIGSYGYSGGGSWNQPTYGYGSSNSGPGLGTGLLIGAASGYLASSLINRISNPWGYSGYGYGYGYMDRYRRYDYDRTKPTPAPVIVDPTKDWINCVAYDPSTRVTMINPNCSCTVTVMTDPVSGQNSSHHDCKPYGPGVTPPPFVQSQPPYGVNNPPPNSGLYSPGASYGGGYGGGASATQSQLTNVGQSVEQQRKDVLGQVEKMVNMGSFTGPPGTGT